MIRYCHDKAIRLDLNGGIPMKHIASLLIIIGMVCNANATEQLKFDDLVEDVFESVSAEGTNIITSRKTLL